MASLLSSRRSRRVVSLRATVARSRSTTPAAEGTEPPALVWPVAAVLGGVATALVGWVLTAGLVVLGWVAAEPGTLVQALRVGSRLWLLANGAGVRLGALPVTLVPWGATAVSAFVAFRFAAFAARQARSDLRAGPLGVAVLLTLAYLIPVAGAWTLLGGPVELTRAVTAVPLTLFAAATWGAAKGLDRPPASRLPSWVRALPRGLVAAQLVLLAGGAAALTWSLLAHLNQVVALTSALDPGVAGGVALVAAQLAYAPNAVVWAGSYALGSGFVLGQGSLVAPAATSLGILPGIPLLAGVPDVGPGSAAALGWLSVAVVAGAVAAVLVLGACRPYRPDTAALLGGAAGVAGALVFVGLAWASGGDLGAVRLAGLGPRLGPLLILAGATLGLSGLVTGLVLGLWRRRRR
jgi:hypothetical protein